MDLVFVMGFLSVTSFILAFFIFIDIAIVQAKTKVGVTAFIIIIVMSVVYAGNAFKEYDAFIKSSNSSKNYEIKSYKNLP